MWKKITHLTSTDREQERRKSDVRINVTYGVVFLYVLMASVFTGILIAINEVEKALVIFGSVATMAAGITGFWFGSRGAGYIGGQSDQKNSKRSSETTKTGTGTTRKPVKKQPVKTKSGLPGSLS